MCKYPETKTDSMIENLNGHTGIISTLVYWDRLEDLLEGVMSLEEISRSKMLMFKATETSINTTHRASRDFSNTARQIARKVCGCRAFSLGLHLPLEIHD